MHNVWTIAKREFNMYFASPVAYAIGFGLLLILGLLFSADFVFATQFGSAPEGTRSLSVLTTLLLFFTPAITMRLLAEEQRTGTIELLLTAPLREWELVTGKWLAAFGFVALLIVLTGVYPLILSRYVTPGLDLGTLWAAYLGMFLLAAAMTAVGVFVSTLFSNQIAAFFGIITFVLLFWLIGYPVENSTGPVAAVVRHLDFRNHYFDNFFSGVVDAADVVYFVSVVVFFLFVAARSIESRRWR